MSKTTQPTNDIETIVQCGHTMRVFVRDSGQSGNKPCIVLVHGIGVSQAYYTPLRRKLLRRFRVIAIDLPGFGRSTRPPDTLSIADYAQVIRAVLERHGVERPLLVGHSMGGQVVAEYDYQYPGTCRGLVLIGATVDPSSRTVRSHAWRLLCNALHEPMAVNALIVRDYLRCDPRHYYRTLRQMMEHYIEDRLRISTSRIIVVRGAKDTIVPYAWARQAADLPAHGALIEVPGGAHVVQYNKAGEIARICEAFFDS